ncbi:WXG100 family type VII secretion target, partial [Micromonospora musae]|uniref:WXG100 family type VII secretion target n=1 Tax=Micromonospora musae TaxID=1894970 RepID=UPI0033E70931
GLTPSELAAARIDCANTAESISAQIEALGRYVDELGTEWMGVAKETFLTLMNEYHAHATSLENTLGQIAANLGASHENVIDAENLNIRLLTPHLDSGPDLAPARF